MREVDSAPHKLLAFTLDFHILCGLIGPAGRSLAPMPIDRPGGKGEMWPFSGLNLLDLAR